MRYIQLVLPPRLPPSLLPTSRSGREGVQDNEVVQGAHTLGLEYRWSQDIQPSRMHEPHPPAASAPAAGDGGEGEVEDVDALAAWMGMKKKGERG